MNGTIVAKIRRILAGHSERSLVHAADDAEREVKLEVPTDSVREAGNGQDHVLLLTWTIQALPRVPAASPPLTAATPPATATAGGETPLPSAVDEEFMAMMTRGRRAEAQPTASPPAPTGAGTSVAEQLAVRLGIRPGRPAS